MTTRGGIAVRGAVSVDLVMLRSIRKEICRTYGASRAFSSRTQCLRTGLTSAAPPALGMWRARFIAPFIDCQRD